MDDKSSSSSPPSPSDIKINGGDHTAASDNRKLLSDFVHITTNRKLAEIPCFRSTFLTAIPSAVTVGLLSFLVTSKAFVAAELAYATLAGVGFGYFVHCRQQYERMARDNQELGRLMKLMHEYRGTEIEAQLQQQYVAKSKEMDKKAKYI